MKKIFLIYLASLVFSCADNVGSNSYKSYEMPYEAAQQEKAFLGYDLNKVSDLSINIKLKADSNEEIDAFVASLKDLDVVEKARMEGLRDGEVYLNIKVLGNYPETLKKIRELPSVFYAEPDYKIGIIGTYTTRPSDAITRPLDLSRGTLENDPVGDRNEYALSITEALRAYKEIGYGSNTVWAGIIDTGTNANHEDLKDKNGNNVVKILKTAFGDYSGRKILDVTNGNSDDEYYEGGHGTHCSGSICASGNNGKGIAGVAWKNVKLASYKGMKKGTGNTFSIYGSLRDLVDSVRKEVTQEKQATVPVNMSLGGPVASYLALEYLNYALSKGFLIVAANGNDGQFLPSYPAAFPGILTVGASGDDDKKTGFSTKGSWLNVVAPGLNIISLEHTSTTRYRYMSGTSMATPFVTGMIAYLLSFDPTLKPYQIVAILEESADKIDSHNQDPVGKYDENGFSRWYGHGRVNVYKAAQMVAEGNVPAPGAKYVERALIVKTSYPRQIVHLYDKNTKLLVGMSISYGTPSKTEFRGLRAGTYNVVCDRVAKEVTIGNDADVTVTF
jgi:prtPI